jgi:hypothetical protein
MGFEKGKRGGTGASSQVRCFFSPLLILLAKSRRGSFSRKLGVIGRAAKANPCLPGARDEFANSIRCYRNPSYSTRDQEFAERLHSRLRDKGLRVWFAPEDMQGGQKMHEQVDEAIRVHDKLLLVLSPHSIDSKWVRDEIRRARKAEVRDGRRKLFPIRLMEYERPEQWESFYADLAEDVAEEIREYFIPDFTKWEDHKSFEAAFARLIRDLKATAAADEGPGREGPAERP